MYRLLKKTIDCEGVCCCVILVGTIGWISRRLGVCCGNKKTECDSVFNNIPRKKLFTPIYLDLILLTVFSEQSYIGLCTAKIQSAAG